MINDFGDEHEGERWYGHVEKEQLRSREKEEREVGGEKKEGKNKAGPVRIAGCQFACVSSRLRDFNLLSHHSRWRSDGKLLNLVDSSES